MNPLDPKLVTGTVGELLVQLRLLQYDVQAAPPLKDTGNDLIAVRGHIFKAVQVKTTGKEDKQPPRPDDRLYHILAFVRLHGEDNKLLLDESEVYLIGRETFENGRFNPKDLPAHLISHEVVDRLFS